MSSWLPALARFAGTTGAGLAERDDLQQQRAKADALQRLLLQRQQTQDAQQAQDRQRTQTIGDAQNAENGIFLGTAPTTARVAMPDLGTSLPSRYTQVGGAYVDETKTPAARQVAEHRTARLEKQQDATTAAATAMQEIVARGVQARLTKADGAGDGGGGGGGGNGRGQFAIGPDGQVINLRQKKAEADLATQYGKQVPIQNASKYAPNAVNTLHSIQAARAGDRSAHFGVLYGYLQQAHPGIAVKRSDKGLLLDTQGLPADAQMKIARWTGKGGLLTPQALDEIEHETHAMTAAQQRLTAPVMAQYGRMARERGGDSINVARDPLAGMDATGGGSSLAQQQRDWDAAAAHLGPSGNAPAILGPRP